MLVSLSFQPLVSMMQSFSKLIVHIDPSFLDMSRLTLEINHRELKQMMPNPRICLSIVAKSALAAGREVWSSLLVTSSTPELKSSSSFSSVHPVSCVTRVW